MNHEKIKKLAEKDPFVFRHKKAGEFLVRLYEEDSPMIQPPYVEIATFMRTPYVPNFENIDIALIGVPFDMGVTNRNGARLGPREIRNKSCSTSGPMHHYSKIIPFDLCRVGDVGDVVEVSPPYDPTGVTALVGATMMFEILCVLADSIASRSK